MFSIAGSGSLLGGLVPGTALFARKAARPVTPLLMRGVSVVAPRLKAPVSRGFVSYCLVCLDAPLLADGFDDARQGNAPRAADVLGTQKTPLCCPVGAASAEDYGSRHLYTVWTMMAYAILGWRRGRLDLYGGATTPS
jgi:hypothetical protein